MQKFVLGVLIKLYQSEPVQRQLDEWETQLLAWLKTTVQDELKSWLPVILKTVITGIAQSAGQLAVNTTDKITDIIPGQVDDQIIDPIVTNALDKLTELTGIKFR